MTSVCIFFFFRPLRNVIARVVMLQLLELVHYCLLLVVAVRLLLLWLLLLLLLSWPITRRNTTLGANHYRRLAYNPLPWAAGSLPLLLPSLLGALEKCKEHHN